MLLRELALEYRAEADRLQERILQLQAELPTARGKKAFAIQKRIEVLNSELYDIRTITGYLLNYYEN